MQFSWNYLHMGQFLDSLTKVIHIPSLLLLFLLIQLAFLNDCAYFGLLFCALLTSNLTNRDRIKSTGEILNSWIFHWHERRDYCYTFFCGSFNSFLILPYFMAVIELHKIVSNSTFETWLLVFLIFLIFMLSLIFLFQRIGSFLCIICCTRLHIYYRRSAFDA